jgi:hypothetical protein
MKAKKSSRSPKENKPSELDAFLTGLVGKLPGVAVGQKFGHVNFTVKKKVFAFSRPDGVAMKLPQETADALVSKKKAGRLVMGKRVMKEWILLKHPKTADYKGNLGLFKESIAFVTGK